MQLYGVVSCSVAPDRWSVGQSGTLTTQSPEASSAIRSCASIISRMSMDASFLKEVQSVELKSTRWAELLAKVSGRYLRSKVQPIERLCDVYGIVSNADGSDQCSTFSDLSGGRLLTGLSCCKASLRTNCQQLIAYKIHFATAIARCSCDLRNDRSK